MNHDKVTETLRRYRSYRYCAKVTANRMGGERVQVAVNSDRFVGIDQWDHNRYTRMVSMIEGAVEEVLSDNQQIVIRWKYLERNKKTVAEIADILNCDPSTVTRWHKEALKELSIALQPLELEEITTFEHMFGPIPA